MALSRAFLLSHVPPTITVFLPGQWLLYAWRLALIPLGTAAQWGEGG